LSSYADTSFLLSAYLWDSNSNIATTHLKEASLPVFLTPFGEFELVNAISLRVFRREIPVAEARDARSHVLRGIDNGVLLRKPIENATYERAEEIARRRTPHLGTRALDILHVASAPVLRANTFYTFDRNQGLLAKAEGLSISPFSPH
jgi:predicted nucleic acid-binding protein